MGVSVLVLERIKYCGISHDHDILYAICEDLDLGWTLKISITIYKK